MHVASKFHNGIITLVFILGTLSSTDAQDRCGTVQYTKILQEKNLIRENNPKFEQWLSRRMQNLGSRISTATTFKIPVVVHVIHNGETLGSGTNISDAQILSQIKVLNSDFRRLNADTAKTPAEFLSLAGKINIEFVLAKQSPQGAVTNGIVRVKGTKTQWTLNDNNTLKALSYWPAEDYMNIWVTDLASTILGYAQFPVSDLPGLEDPEGTRLTDGVVLDYRIVGSTQDGSFNLTYNFNRGRTATHEVGHFLGLRHIWGDDEGACSGYGDYVEDTPNQGNSSSGCPSHPQISCNTQTMFQNYMDYTNDLCMNLYTKKQVERMLTVLENSPRRISLLTSNGSYDPSPANDDLAIIEIQSPSGFECSGNVVPKATVRNKGQNPVTSAKVQLKVGDAIVETKNVFFSSLAPDEEAEILFAPFTLSPGNLDFYFDILLTNLNEDGKINDNSKTITVEVPHELQTPFSENFNSLPDSWRLLNDDGKTTWSISQTGPVSNLSNSALFMQYFQSSDESGEKDVVITPVIDLSQATSPFLAFDVAYGRYQNRSDGLEVQVLLNCQGDLTGDVIYSKNGAQLATVLSTTGSFSPSNENQWRRELIDLRAFIGQSHIQFAFVGINGNGNNLYLDNIALRTELSDNISIAEVISPSPVQCSNEVRPSFAIENKGSTTINNLKVVYFWNEEAPQTVSIADDFTLAPGEETIIDLPTVTLSDGENLISLEVTHPNGFKDIDSTDNAVQIKAVVNNDQDKIPLRKNFDSESENDWQIVNPVGDMNWEIASTNYNKSLYFAGEDAASDDQQYSWFVSPVLDLSNTVTASLFFDLSYGIRSIDSIKDSSEEIFRVLASRDCGKTFDEVLFSSNEKALPENSGQGDGTPASNEDWKRIYLNLNSIAGEENARIAFVVSSGISNPIYLDNIEFFLSDDPSPITTSELYTLYPNKLEQEKSFYVTFNLPDRQSVAYELIDMLGKQVGTQELTDVLNQTYKIDVEDASNGMYLVRLLIDKKYYVSRIIVYQ